MLEIYHEFRSRFTEIAKRTDIEHIKFWEEIDPQFSHSWFESLAKVVNLDISRGVPAKEYKQVFEFLRQQYHQGDEVVINCIDVAFVENLFWQVPKLKVKSYWVALPQVFKDLYVAFHFKSPLE